MNEYYGLRGPSVRRVFADGESAQVDGSVKFYGSGEVRVGKGSRIDAFCVITVGEKGVWIGENVHLGVGVCLFGSGGGIQIGDNCSLSPRSTIYTASDDFRKAGLIGPTNPREQRNVIEGDVTMEEGSALGHGAVLFPGAVLEKMATVGAYCLVTGPIAAGEYVVRNHGYYEEKRT